MTMIHAENPHAGQGTSVLLDIGGDVGALLVTMPDEMEGVEVEIRPIGATGHDHGHDDGHGHDHHHGHQHHPHVAVVRRPVGNVLISSLVFPDLREGGYELYVKDTLDVRLVVGVTGGEVTTAEWPD